MCDCFHLAFPNWHAAPSGTAGRRLRAPEPATQDDSICEEPTQFAEGERPRPQGSSPIQEYPEAAKYTDKECEEHDADHKAGSGHKGKKSGLGSIFERTSTPKMSKLKEAPSPEGGVIVNTAQDGCAEGLVYGGGGKEGIFIKKVVPESPASKSLKVKEGDQILSATVYFDNMSYEDAIQILEHAQAYKLKLCLKRQPDITETEPTIDSDVIPEEEVSSTEMREQGKTRRRGDARISWPKFPSFGKGRKSRFTRSHSSSEADEQRKLELSPTTSDTESPIKSQVALKGKKKHKIKLSGLTKRGRISSSEDQDTDAPTSGQMSSDVQQKQESDTLSPEFPEYPIAETSEINEQAGEAVESGPVQHKVELVSVDATLKTGDQTVVLGDQEGQSGAPKSPDEKKKKKERSELNIKILGKDKSHKKDAKAKSSPKRLKTLGASVETEDLPEAGKSAAISSSESKTKLLGDQCTVSVDSKNQGGESSKLISSKSITSQLSLPKVELDISVRKSPKKVDDKTQKGKEMKQKQSKKSSPKHKQPELGMSNVANAEEMQKVNDQEPTTITGCVSTTQLPKREDIEIPGMEDMSVKTTVENKADFKKRNKESKAETVQMSIDVDSVKEAVSKLPGFKLPQLDISGVPIPEEITVIDANAQRISVKTPTKVVKPKQEHLTSSDTSASSEISKTIFLTDSRFDFKKSQMEDSTSPTKCKGEEETKEKEFDTTNGKAATTEELKTSTRPKITMPSFGMSAKSRRLPYIGIDMQKPSFIQEKELTMETRKDERQTGEVICKVKIPELDGIEYIDSTDESFKKDGGLTSFNVNTDTKTILAISLESKETSDKPEDERNKLFRVGLSPSGTPSGKEDISDEGTTKPLDRDGKNTFKWPNLDISVPKVKGTTVINTSKIDTAHTEAPAKEGLISESDTLLKSSDVPKEIAEAEKPQVEIKPTETEGEFDWKASKFAKFGIKTPKIKVPEFDLSLSKTEVHGKAAGKLPETSKTEITPGKGNVYFLKQKMQLEKPGEVKPLQSKGEHVQGGKIKIPKFGVKTTKLAGPEISLSQKDAEVTVPEVKTEIKLTEGSETDVNKDSVRPEEKKGIEKSDLKIKTMQKEGEAKGHKIKMPQLGIALPKVTTHESDLSLSKKGKDLTLPEVKGEIKDFEVEGTGSPTKLDVRAPGVKVETKDVEGSSSKFKMSPFKIPRIGAATPNLSGELSEASEIHTVEDGPGIDATIPDTDVKIKASEIDGRASKFKIPKFGISLPKLKGSETNTTQSQKVDVDVTLFKDDTEIKLVDAEHEEPDIRMKGKFPQIGVQQDVQYSASKPEITVPFSDAKAEVKVLEVDGEKINFSSPLVLNETPELEIPTMKAENHLDGQEEKIKLSKIGIKMPKIKGPEFQLGLSSKDTDVIETESKVDNKAMAEVPVPTADVSLGKAEILIPSERVEVGKPEVQTQLTVEGQGGRFKMPKFGITMPKVKGPEAKRDVEVKLTETKTGIKIPDADFEAPDVEQSPSKFNMPTFKLPKLGLGTSDKNVEGDDIDKDIPDEVLEVTIVAPSADLLNIDVDTHLLESKTEVALSSDDMDKYSIEVEATAPQIKVSKKEKEGSPSKFKMPTFKLPKFGLSVQRSTEEEPPLDKDIKTGEDEITTTGEIHVGSLEAPRIDVKAPSVALKTTGTESEGRGRKFKLPSLGFSASQTKGPDTDVTLPTTDVDVTLPTTDLDVTLPTTDLDVTLPATDVDVTVPQVKTEIKLPEEKFNKSFEVEAKAPEFKGTRKETEGSPSKFKMPTFKMPKFGLSVQSSTSEVPPLDKDLKTGECEITTSGEILVGSLEAPRIDIKAPSGDLKTTGTESEGRGKKFKLPSLGFSASQTKGPDTDITLPTTDVNVTLPTADVDVTLPTTDVDVTVPEVKGEIKIPEEKFNKSFEVEAKAPEFQGTRIETEGSSSKFKVPTFKMPKFGLSVQSSTAEVPPLHKDLKTGECEINTSGEILVGSLEPPSVDVKPPFVDLKTTGTESEGRGRKFKLPSLGFSASQTKGPDTDITLPTTDVDVTLPTTDLDFALPTTDLDVTLPQVKTEIKLPEEKLSKSFEVEAKAPEFKGTRKETEGSPSKFKMPTFKMPKFGLSVQSSTTEVPPLDKDLKTGEGEITTSGEILAGSLEAPRIDIKAPSGDLKTTGTESEGRGKKFKLPSLGFSASQTKGPDIDITLPTTDVNVTLPTTDVNVTLPTADVDVTLPTTDVDVTVPEDKAEIKIPEEKLSKSFEVEAKAPEFKGTKIEKDGSPSKYKMPTFKMPKFGLSVQSSTAEVPSLDKDLKITGGEMTMSEEVIVVSTEGPSVEIGDLSIESKKQGSEREGKGKRFKLPSLGFSATQAKVPDTDLSLKTGVDVTQPELKAEVKFSDDEMKRIETEIETKGPEFQVEAKDIEGSTSKFKMPTFKFPKFGLATQSSTEELPSFNKGGETTGLEEVLTVTTEGPSIEIKGTSVDLSTEESDLEGKGRKFKLPSLSFSVPQAKEPETDLSLRTDVEIKVPEVKAEVKLPSNKSSVEVETKALETKDTKKTTEGSPSKFKMPNFKLPKFGLATQTSTGEVPPLDKSVKPVEGKITTSEEVIVVTTEAPTIEIQGPLLELKTEGIDCEEKGKKFKLPSLGFSATEAKGTGSDLGLSKAEVDITLPEVKADVKFPDDKNLIKTSSAIEIKGPEIKTVTKDTDGLPSKFKMPAFKLPKFGLTTQSSTEEGNPLEKDEEDSEPKNTVTTIGTKATEITVVSKDTDGSPSKFKMPTFKLPKFGLATQSSNKQVQDAKTVKGESTTLEEVLTVTTEEPSIEIKGPSVDLRSSEIDDERKGSKFKLPSLGFSLSQSKGPDTNISLPKADVDVTAPEVKAEVQFSDVKVEQPSVQMDIKSPEIKADIDTTSEVKMPKITLPKFRAVTPHVSMEIPKMTKEKRGDVDLHVDTDPVDLNVKEGELKKYDGAESKGEDEPTVELEGKVKRPNWTFPSISFSRTGGKASEVDVNMETPKAGVTSMEPKISDVDVNKSSMVLAVEATPAPELDPGLKKSKFSLPRFSFSKSSLKEPEVKADLQDYGIEVENYETNMTTEIKLSANEDKYVLTAFEMTTSEAEVKSKKFKMPTLKMPRFGSVPYEATTETHISDKTAEDNGSQLGEGAAVIIKGPKIDFKLDAPKSEQPDQETLNTESDSAVQGSPSKFKLPTFKIPRLGLSRSKPEDESVHFEHENIEDQLEMKTEPKEENLSPKPTLTSFGDILKSIDVDLDVRKVDKVDQDVETSKESHEPGEPTTMHIAAKTKHDTTKSPESSSWFKFPKFGLSSPTEQQKIPDKAEQVKDGSPVGETKDEEISPTLSVQSSDAFADVSSTITSEPVGPFIPSPTKVTVKYSDESASAGLEEMHSDIMTSTTRTELITDVPSLPEKITILSSGVSSSSEDTVRLTSGKIHIITSNIQPTRESQHAKILPTVQAQSAEGFALQLEGDEAPSWMMQDVQSATRTVKHLVQETTTERSENKETVVITKQITHIFGPTEPISGETASSIQRLKDSVHTEKMRFFDEAEK